MVAKGVGSARTVWFCGIRCDNPFARCSHVEHFGYLANFLICWEVMAVDAYLVDGDYVYDGAVCVSVTVEIDGDSQVLSVTI